MVSEAHLTIGCDAARSQAIKSLNEGGIPIGASLVIDGVVASLGHNRRVQLKSNILHGETDCIERAGHHADFPNSILFSTLSPCLMCSGAVQLFRIPTVVVMDDDNTDDFVSGIDQMRAAGVDVIIRPDPTMIEIMHKFQTDAETRPIWLGDVGI
ncbi:MAG: nucleoside deaminase [Pseudomonadota bacterium]